MTWKYSIEIDLSDNINNFKCFSTGTFGTVLKSEVKSWLGSHVGVYAHDWVYDDRVLPGKIVFRFADPAKAIMFKMTWL